jgi:hypothetical protein
MKYLAEVCTVPIVERYTVLWQYGTGMIGYRLFKKKRNHFMLPPPFLVVIGSTPTLPLAGKDKRIPATQREERLSKRIGPMSF